MMKKIDPVGTLSLVLCTLHLISCEANDNTNSTASEIPPFLLRGQQNHRNLERPDHPCVLVRVETEYEQIEEETMALFPGIFADSGQNEKKREEYLCELIDDDVFKVNHYFVPIVGLEIGYFDGIESGISTLVADGAIFLDGALQIPQDASIEIGSIDDYIDKSDEDSFVRWRMLRSRQKKRRLAITGQKKVLVVRADAIDGMTTANIATLSDNIFGTSGDSVTLKSQYDECSYGKLTFEPYDDIGVIDVELNSNVQGADKFAVQNAMMNAASDRFGDLPLQFDHVMLCVPPGTGDWIAYAYVNSWLAVFNDDWCQQLSTQVHEIGHNLGLAHSGVYPDNYADKSGMMGYSFKADNGPLQCFNPAKSYELGWYENSVVEWDPLIQGTWFGNIVGVADYDENSSTQTVIVKITRESNSKNLFIGYNRKKGINSGVTEHGDEVVIIEEADGYEVSNFVGGLNPKVVSSKKFYNFDGNANMNLVVDFSSYGSSDSEDEAFVAIYFEDCSYPDCCIGEMCDTLVLPLTETPVTLTQAPTISPTKSPTKSPTETLPVPMLREADPTPIIFEILPNPTRKKEQYIEIYNPHSIKISLKDYKLCMRDGRKGKLKCYGLKNFTLDPGEYFMLCRNEDFVPYSRTCHLEKNIRIRKRRNQFFTLERVIGDTQIPVDGIMIEPPKRFKKETYVRKNTELVKFCDGVCWNWSKPESASIEQASIEQADEGILEDSQSLPPTDESVPDV